jgi:hypothetical protein
VSEPLRGRALAVATLEYIETHPEEWDQSVWMCDTAACFAGHAVLLGGIPRGAIDIDIDGSWLRASDDMIPISDVAAGMLFGEGVEGDDDGPADLFSPTNTLADLRRCISAFFPEAPHAD